jgi:polysaccharide deacetylase family protein (PEP-CTERM system associated)
MKTSSSAAPIPDAAATRPKQGASTTSFAHLEPLPVVLSFDVEEHFRIEAASGLEIGPNAKSDYGQRMVRQTEWILQHLAEHEVQATFFVVGEVGVNHPKLIRSIHEAGHEVASHGWDHRPLVGMTRDAFRKGVRQSQDALQQACGAAVVGFRAPTFSLLRKTAWAVDVLAELGLLYDSSIYPVHHDRYGIPDAPRGPFLAQGNHHEILEMPPATLRIGATNIPVGGGGYFRLLPLPLTKLALYFSRLDRRSGATVLYFHPWEFDPDQPRLPLTPTNRFRTYVGIRHNQRRLLRLIAGYRFTRAVDLAQRLDGSREYLRRFHLAPRASTHPMGRRISAADVLR